MDKLTIGIFLETSLDRQVGGAFSYYEALVEAIDQYQFDPALQFKFINSGLPREGEGSDKLLNIHPYSHLNKNIRYKQQFNHQILRRVKKIVTPLSKLHYKFQNRFNVAYTKSVEEELVKNKIDLIYYLYPQDHTFNHPFVSTHWDIGHRSMFSFPEVGMNDTFAERKNYFHSTLEKAFAIFCESKAGKEEIIHYTTINEDRVFVVPIFPGNVISLTVSSVDQTEFLRKYSLTSKGYFFYPAQFWSHKNHYNLIVAFQKIKQSNPGIKLLFAGSDKGNLEYIMNVISDFGLNGSVVIPGFVPGEEIYTFYKHALALVMPTFLGPTNMPLLEAEALGCPVICSNLKGHWEMLGEHACYVEPNNPESIYQGMKDHLQFIPRKPRINEVFNLTNAVKQIETNFLHLKPRRKTFGFNFNQY